MSEEEQRPLLMAFGFFAVGDGSIASMLAYRMILIAPNFESQMFYAKQLENETVHGETYGRMIYELVRDPRKRDEIFNAVENVSSIKRMNGFIEDAFNHPNGKRQTYVSLAAAEYLLFTPLFCIIFWYRAYRKGKIPRIILSNEYIAKDEAAHCENGCMNYQALLPSEKYTNEEIHAYLDQVVNLVSDFADEVLGNVHLDELTPANVKQYVRFVADDLLIWLGHSKYYNVSSPFIWMNLTDLIPKTNFYEGVVTEYGNLNVTEVVRKAKELCGEKVAAKRPKKLKF